MQTDRRPGSSIAKVRISCIRYGLKSAVWQTWGWSRWSSVLLSESSDHLTSKHHSRSADMWVVSYWTTCDWESCPAVKRATAICLQRTLPHLSDASLCEAHLPLPLMSSIIIQTILLAAPPQWGRAAIVTMWVVRLPVSVTFTNVKQKSQEHKVTWCLAYFKMQHTIFNISGLISSVQLNSGVSGLTWTARLEDHKATRSVIQIEWRKTYRHDTTAEPSQHICLHLKFWTDHITDRLPSIHWQSLSVFPLSEFRNQYFQKAGLDTAM